MVHSVGRFLRLLRLGAFAFGAATAVASACVAQVLPSEESKRRLRERVAAAQADEELVGVQLAILHHGVLAFSMEIGFADLEHQVPVRADTRFEVASINKVFTGLGLLLLAEAGDIDLDAPVQNYVPGFPTKPQGAITPRLLSGGLSGIRHYNETERTPAFYATHYEDVVGALEIFDRDPLVATPGERFVYSSYAYNLLAATIQGASGMSYPDYIQKSVLDPLGLRDTGQIDVRVPMPNRARIYGFIDPYTRKVADELRVLPTLEHSYNRGGGNMYSTARDLVALGGELLEPDVLPKRVVAQVFAPHRTSAGEPTWFSDGWLMIEMGSKPPSLIAGGSYPGVQAVLRVYPEEGLVVALLTNTWGKLGAEGAFMRSLAGDLAEVMLSAPE